MHKPITRRGFTLLELAVGIAVAGILALVSAGLFKAGIESYNYAYRQTRVIFGACRSFSGSGSRLGIIWMTQTASSVTDLSASALTLISPASTNVTFSALNNGLYRTQNGEQLLQADSVSAAEFRYYNLDTAGRIVVSTSASSAVFVTAKMSMSGIGAKDKTYNFMSGARLLNK